MTYSKQIMVGIVLVLSSVNIKSMDLLSPEITKSIEGAALAVVTELIMRVSYGEEPKDKFSEESRTYKLKKDSITVFIKTAIDPFFAGNLTTNLPPMDPRKYLIDSLFQSSKTVAAKIVNKTIGTGANAKTESVIDITLKEPTAWEKAVTAFEHEAHPMEQCPALPQTSPDKTEPLKEPDNSYWGMFVNTWYTVAEKTTGAISAVIDKVSEQIPQLSNMALSCAVSWLIYKVVQLIVKQFDPTTLACTAVSAGVLIPICTSIVNQILEYLYRQTGIAGTYYLNPFSWIKPVLYYVSDYLKPAANTLIDVELEQQKKNPTEETLVTKAQESIKQEKEQEPFVKEAITKEKEVLKNNKDSKE